MLAAPDVIAGSALPVGGVLPEIVAALAGGGSAVLVAPPGTGKTTLVPLALADAYPGRIIVAEPRRVAVRAAARRMASLVGGPVGGLIGYSVRGETRVGKATRVEVLTTGVLLRRLQRDPELAGVGAVMLDECHERHLDTDLALAFLVDVRATLRPDLALLAASATVDADRLASCLGDPAPIVPASAVLFPTEILWSPPEGAIRPAYGLQVDPRLLDHVATTVHRALREASGDILVFLPGVWEIDAVASRLGNRPSDVDLVMLHGRQSAQAQDAALVAGPRRRIVLASAVAESSLTVPGVRIVVDAGLAREPRVDHARGLGALVTVRVSRAAATQRAGRAGREGPGRVYRCWSAADHERLAAHAQPEVAIADLTGFALELACWGHPEGTGLALPDPPPVAAMQVARTVLRDLGALDGAGRVTDRGRTVAGIGAHPRLARALIDGSALVGSERAAQIVAMLSDDGLAGGSDDLMVGWRRLRDGVDRGAAARWRDEVRRLALPESARRPSVPDDLAAGLVIGLAFPERLASARSAGARSYLMAGGTAADLAQASSLHGAQWVAIAVADRAPGAVAARIRLAAVIDQATAVQAGASLLTEADEIAWIDGDVVARHIERLGAIVLRDEKLARPDPVRVAEAVLDGLGKEGLAVLTWSPAARALRERLAFAHAALGWPPVDDDALAGRAQEWLGPDLARVRNRSDLGRIDLVAALRRLLDWRQAARLDEVAPERLAVPSGSRIRVDYGDPDAPVLAVKIQEAFGWRQAPAIADGRVTVVLHLLSPAGRPAAVTRDLPSFWANTYPVVRAELRARYPRHAWPDDPTSAPPAKRPPPRGAGR